MDQKTIFKVVTKRSADMIKSFVRFSYRQAHPKVSRNFMIFGLVNYAIALGITIQGIRIAALIIGTFCVLMSLFRHWIPVTMLRAQDPDYTAGNELSYTFTDKGIKCARNGDIFLEVANYSKVHHLYHDEKYFYLGANEEDLMVLPKSDFVVGDPEEFADFIRRKSGTACYWSPDTFSERRKKNQADALIRQEKGRIQAEQQMAEREKAIGDMKKALKERKDRRKK